MVSGVFSGVENGVWVWVVVVWCVALRGLRWSVLFGCAGAVVCRPEAERGGVASCPGWTAGLTAPVTQAAVAGAVSPPRAAAELLRALLVCGVGWSVVAVWMCVWCGVCGVGECVARWVGVAVYVGVFVFVAGGGGVRRSGGARAVVFGVSREGDSGAAIGGNCAVSLLGKCRLVCLCFAMAELCLG